MPSNKAQSAEEILIVDDKPANLRLLSQMLADRGFIVRAVKSGPRALESVRATPPNLILLDIKMPGMDGYEVCRQLKELRGSRGIPVIFISALNEIQNKVQGFNVGGVDYITKPFQYEEVIARVETHLALRRFQKRLQKANKRYEKELKLAGSLQANLIPKQAPAIPGYQLSFVLRSARETSGDFYDFFPLNSGHFGILVADVVDKGAGAALLMAFGQTLLRTLAEKLPDHPDRVLKNVNQRMLSYIDASHFITVFYAILEPEKNELVYSNAGHNPAIHLKAANGEIQLLKNTGIPLGLYDDQVWQKRKIQLDPGDLVVIYTDGITDAQNSLNELYGMDRFSKNIQANRNRPPAELEKLILEDIDRFLDGAPQPDDMALVILRKDE
ncbi:MAG: SpoIIE family protein phosphatase [Chloroflexota bacterium]|nr:SpoIIE family protein phosphatase [Chloroflexota bacterium]